MALALALTAFIAIGAASSEEFMHAIHGLVLKWMIAFTPLGMAFYMGNMLIYMSQTSAQSCLMIFMLLWDYFYSQYL